MFERCCGVDVHRDTLVATIRIATDKQVSTQNRTFATYADGIEELSRWLDKHSVEAVMMEATGVYFQPLVHALRRLSPHRLVSVANPSAVKQIPGRKTDVSDSAWLAKLLMNGVVSPSFIPSEQLEELRKLSRYRAKKVGVKNATKNRIIKLVESEGIKLATVLSDVLGKSGRAMLQALVDGGQSAEQMAELAQGSLRHKKAELVRALSNPVNETTLWILRQLLDDLTQEEARIAQVEAELSRRLQASYSREMALLQTIPGIAEVIAATIVAETGADMSVFPSAAHLASWAGLAPGNHQSAGKSRKAPVRPGNPWLRTALVQAAHVLARKRDSPLRAFFLRVLHNSANYNKAIIAVARKLAVTVYYALRDGEVRWPEPTEISGSQQARLKQQLVTRLETLGYSVSLAKKDPGPTVS
ncbi:MAG: IS110 family transposase [Polyangiaceae bacterium]